MKLYQEVVTVAAAGTPVVVPAPTGDVSNDKRYSKIGIFPLNGNTGANCYVGITSTFSKTTGVGLISPPISKGGAEYFLEEAGVTNGIVPAQFYVDVDTNGDKVIVLYYKG